MPRDTKDDLTAYNSDTSPEKLERGVETIERLPIEAAENLHYGPNGFRGIFSSGFVFGACFLASLGGFSFGYDQGVISIINVMPQFHTVFPRAESEFGKGFMTGMLLFGAFVGCLFMPYLADKISRKWALTVCVVIFDVGAIIQTCAKDYGTLVAGRTIGGIGVGTLAMGAPLYISEIAPPNIRGILLVLESVSIVLGVIVAFWITFGTRFLAGEISFRLPLGLQMVSATAIGFGIHFFPYSPRWLALVDRSDECLTSLTKLRQLPSTDHRVQTEYAGIMTEIEFQRIMQERRHPGVRGPKLELFQWLALFNRRNIRRTIVGVGVMFFQQFSGINAFIYYAPTLFESIGQSPEMALIMSGIFNILQLVAVVVCFFIIDNVGRRPLAIFGGFSTAGAYVIISVLSALYSEDWSGHTSAGWACVAMAFIFILTYGVSYSPLGWALPPEVYSNSDRSKGVALCVAVNWLCNFIIGVATPPMLANIGYKTYVFFAVCCLMSGFWAVFLLPETKGKTLEQIDELFEDATGLEEQEILRSVAQQQQARH
ncbi:hypothetical protein N0V90_004477 [Kalmusia sp. IMI 367209]|nr:hypothetical protein N0V90_004477 [Kalmusia sp. IMI 367209]